MGSTPSTEKTTTTISQEDILTAIKHGDTKLMSHLKDMSKQFKQRSDASTSNLLHFAAYHGQEEWVKFFIEQEFNVNGLNEGNEIPLHTCVRARHNGLACAKLILQAKSDINARNAWGRSPLMEAVVNFKFQIVDFLLSEGADVNLCDSHKTSPLHVCASYGNLDNVKKLLSKGADQNAQDERGRTCLYFAINGNHQEVITYLIQNGCNVNLYDPNFGSPLQKALTMSNVNLVYQLINVGASTAIYNTSRLTNMTLSLTELAVHTIQVALESCPSDVDYEDGQLHGQAAKALRHIHCFRVLIIAHGFPIQKSVRDKLKHITLKCKVPCLKTELSLIQNLANSTAHLPTKGHVTTLQSLSRFQCRKYLMKSKKNVIWASNQLHVPSVLKNILTLKL